MPALIVLGDKTDHGGEVIEASGVTDTHGRCIARIGDKVQCPKKGHGTTEIVDGDPTFVIDGKGAAYHGCRTSCGAILISSQCPLEFGGGSASGSAGSVTAAAAVAQGSSLKFDHDAQAQLVSAAGMPWFIKARDGRTLSGVVGEDGLLPRVDSYSEDEFEVFWGDEALAMKAGA